MYTYHRVYSANLINGTVGFVLITVRTQWIALLKELEELAAHTGTSDEEIGNEDIAGLIRPMATIFHKRQLYQANGQNM